MSVRYTVVIPAYNAASTIADAIRSVLSQTLPPTEVVVVDDGSTDDTSIIASGFGSAVRLMRQANRGPGAATTAGIGAVSTPLLATLDSDDLWLPRKIERQVEHLARHPEATAVFTLARLFQGTPSPDGEGPVQRLWSRTTLLIDTEAARSIGEMVDPPGGRGEMIDWLAKAREAGHRLEIVEEVLALRRIRPGSLSYGRDRQRDVGYLHVARRALERRRLAMARAQEGAGG